ncbi:MAG: hypothetical protein V7638_4816 [Acidobacteriota bacterium]|jgi:hypothetical protein
MRRRKTVKQINVLRPRSLAWAAQLTQRYARFAGFSELSMLWHVPALARTLVLLQQRRLTSLIKLQPQLNLSFNQQQNVSNTWTKNVSAPQMALVNLLTLANLATRRSTSESATALAGPPSSVLDGVRRTRYVSEYDKHRRLALTLAIDRTSTDLATKLSRKFLVQSEAQLREVSTVLTQRVQRISEPAAVQTPMALHTPLANRVATAESSIEAMRSREAFARRSVPPSTSPITPPALNVEMLTDAVMKQIDRRVIARRERVGQI